MSILLGNPLLFAPTAAGGYTISRSLRFNSADSAYLSRTPASAGNRRTWTWAGWVKKVKNESILPLYNGRQSSSNFTNLWFDSGDGLFIRSRTSGSDTFYAYTSAVFRDPSAWYHVVISVDTTQATAANGLKFYVNGVQQTLTISTYNQNADSWVNDAQEQRIGYLINQNSSTYYLDAYLADCFLIDGQQLDPSSFGEFSATTGIWQPKKYSGPTPTGNSFWLPFSDNSAATATTLGKDNFNLGNNWTPNNLSVTAGAGNDSLIDVPVNGSEVDTGLGNQVRGNYCTLNPLTTTGGTYSQGNLRYESSSTWRRSNGTIAASTGKWYWEVTLANAPFAPRNINTAWHAFGFGLSSVSGSTTVPISVSDAVVLSDSGYYKNFSNSQVDGGAAFSSGDVLSCAVDLDANTFTFRRNNTQIATGTIGGTAGRELVPIIISYDYQYGVMDCNFGQRPFAYTAPSGFKALCTANLPAPLVTKPSDLFDVSLYTGNSSARSIAGLGFSPDFVWIKNRSSATGHRLLDTVRGATKALISQGTDAEVTETQGLTAFNADGFSLGTGAFDYNQSGNAYAAWCWDAGNTTVTNTQGSITSQVRANPSAGFSVVTYTGTATSGSQTPTVGHGLGVAPKLVITKRRDGTSDWVVQTDLIPQNYLLYLNSTSAQTSISGSGVSNIPLPTSSVFTAAYITGLGVSGHTHVAYCFSPVNSYSSFGSYVGNGSADGPFVYTGFRPRWVMIKITNTGTSIDHWVMWDTARDDYNVADSYLLANNPQQEVTSSAVTIDALSNGFKLRNSSSNQNGSGSTYIYAAFAEAPFQYARAR